ncbi:MAG: hypothetical protein WBB17_09635 [Saprospiraceae bacterium]
MIIIVKLEYHGRAYCGWQRQIGQTTVQEVIEVSLSKLLKRTIDITGCGRTDTGVHAINYIAHFEGNQEDIIALNRKSINSILPKDISVQNLYFCNGPFHSRFDAISRKYIYKLHTQKTSFNNDTSCFNERFASYNQTEFETLSNLLLTQDNFKSFAKLHSSVENFNCKVQQVIWIQKDDKNWEFHIAANRFLRGMVRLLVGTYFNLGTNKISIDQIKFDLENKAQITKAWSVPAHGLILVNVEYPQSISDLWVEIN